MDTSSNTETMTDDGQDNMQAAMQARQALLMGYQEFAKTLAATVQGRVDHAWSIWKSMGSVGSLQDMIDLQTSIARRLVEQAVADSGALNDASSKFVKQTMVPVKAYMAHTVGRFTIPIASSSRV